MRRTRLITVGLLALLLLGPLTLVPSVRAEPLAAGPARFIALPPTRVLDTRAGLGARPGPVGPGETLDIAVVPTFGVTAAIVNITATNALRPGFIQVFPTGGAIGTSSSLNVERVGQTVSNLVVVPMSGVGGKISIYTQGGADLLADVMGYFTRVDSSTFGRYVAVPPTRMLDTRSGFGALPPVPPPDLAAVDAYKVPSGGTVRVRVRDAGPIPATGAAVVVLNVTATQANPGYIQVIPTGGTTRLGDSSNINVTSFGQSLPNAVVVPIGADGTITLFSEAGAHLLVDVMGYFTDITAPPAAAGLFVPVRPERALDTRVGTGAPASKLGAGGQLTLGLRGVAGIPADAGAAFLNVTATDANPGYVQVFPTGHALPGSSSNLNVTSANQTIPNAVFATLAPDTGLVTFFTEAGAHLVADVGGYFTGA